MIAFCVKGIIDNMNDKGFTLSVEFFIYVIIIQKVIKVLKFAE